MEQLFTQALGLSPPWAVTSVDFRQPEGAIYFSVDCQAKRLACPACGASDQPIHDRIERRWQHLHFFQFRASSMPTAVGGVHAVNFSAARRPCVDETHARRGQRST